MENRAKDLNENWTKWNPANAAAGQYIVTNLIQDINGTKIVLDDEKTVIEIFFDGVTPLVRSSVEGMRMRTWGEIQAKKKDKSFFRDWFLYQVENSTLVQWVVEESCGFYEAEKLKHFCIVTGEEIIDVLATFVPSVKATKY